MSNQCGSQKILKRCLVDCAQWTLEISKIDSEFQDLSFGEFSIPNDLLKTQKVKLIEIPVSDKQSKVYRTSVRL